MKEYGLTAEAYQEMWEVQNGRCAICLNKQGKKKLAVDHNHKTGRIRGLLCTRCNHKLLGSAKDNPEILKRAVGYLEWHPG